VSRRGGPPAETEALGRYPSLVGGDGPPLVYLTGLMPKTGVAPLRGMHTMSLIPYAGRRTVHLVNRRSALPRGMTVAQLCDELAAAMRERFGEPVDVLGLSTGGSIAQQLAADQPDVVRRLALLSTGHRLSPETRAEMRRIAARIRLGASRRALAVGAASLLPGSPWAFPAALGAAAFGRRWLTDADLADLATTIELEDGFALEQCADPIGASTLVVGGERDLFYPVAMFERTAALIPGARLDVRPGRGHVSVTGMPAVHQAILDHLDGD
jgi:pimeloyl-ACP methyl ester carboxylesterase